MAMKVDNLSGLLFLVHVGSILRQKIEIDLSRDQDTIKGNFQWEGASC